MVCKEATLVRTDDDNPLSETIIYAVASARGVCPTELETPLYEAIPTDALDSLFSGGAGPDPKLDSVHVEFTWAGCDVTVQETGRVVVTQKSPE